MKIEKEDLRESTIFHSPFGLTGTRMYIIEYVNHEDGLCTVSRWNEERNKFIWPKTIMIPNAMFTNEYEAQQHCVTMAEEYLREAKENLEKMKGEFNEK